MFRLLDRLWTLDAFTFAMASAAMVGLLTACSGGDPAPLAAETSGGAAASASPMSSRMRAHSVADGALPGAMLVHWRPTSTTFGPVSNSDSLALPIDAATGIEMDGRSPFALGNVPQTSVSPDGRFLAVTSRGTDEVKLYDLRAWQLVATMKAVPGLVVESWSSDGSQLFAWRDYCAQPASEGRCPAG